MVSVSAELVARALLEEEVRKASKMKNPKRQNQRRRRSLQKGLVHAFYFFKRLILLLTPIYFKTFSISHMQNQPGKPCNLGMPVYLSWYRFQLKAISSEPQLTRRCLVDATHSPRPHIWMQQNRRQLPKIKAPSFVYTEAYSPLSPINDFLCTV